MLNHPKLVTLVEVLVSSECRPIGIDHFQTIEYFDGALLTILIKKLL
jgi:hypothetical protein